MYIHGAMAPRKFNFNGAKTEENLCHIINSAVKEFVLSEKVSRGSARDDWVLPESSPTHYFHSKISFPHKTAICVGAC